MVAAGMSGPSSGEEEEEDDDQPVWSPRLSQVFLFVLRILFTHHSTVLKQQGLSSPHLSSPGFDQVF